MGAGTNTLLQGRYGPCLAVWTGLCTIFMAASWSLGEHTPLGLALLGYALLVTRSLVRDAGRFTLGVEGAVIHPLWGKARHLALSDIERVQWQRGHLVLHLRQEPDPVCLSSGLFARNLETAWLVLCFARKVPTSVWHRVFEAPRQRYRPHVMWEVRRDLFRGQQRVGSDIGIAMYWASSLIYVPTTLPTLPRALRKSFRCAFETTRYPSTNRLPITALARALTSSSLTPARQIDLWRDLAHQCGGTVCLQTPPYTSTSRSPFAARIEPEATL